MNNHVNRQDDLSGYVSPRRTEVRRKTGVGISGRQKWIYDFHAAIIPQSRLLFQQCCFNIQRFRIWGRDEPRRVRRDDFLSHAEPQSAQSAFFCNAKPPRPMDRVLTPSVLSEGAGAKKSKKVSGGGRPVARPPPSDRNETVVYKSRQIRNLESLLWANAAREAEVMRTSSRNVLGIDCVKGGLHTSRRRNRLGGASWSRRTGR